MTRDRLVEINAISDDIYALEKLLRDIKLLGTLTTNCSNGFHVKGTDFRHATVVYNLCNKFKPIVEAELERLNSEFKSS